MIKAIITDVDGVIVGDKHGINFPLPNEKVIHKLKELHKTGFPIVFCTAKFQSGIHELVQKTELANPHITDGGALIIDPLDNKIIKAHSLPNQIAAEIVKKCLANNINILLFGVDKYYLQKGQVNDITKKEAAIFQQDPIIVDDLSKQVESMDVLKLTSYFTGEEERQLVESFIADKELHVMWTHHPTMLPTKICVITQAGVSKRHASVEVLDYLQISPEETLAIGDTLGDWHFMDICRYAGVVGAHEELQKLAKEKGKGNYFLGGSIDDDGFLQILDYFKL